MPELRYNIATGDWTIFATERAKRPHDFIKPKETKLLPEYQENCPFCPGNESKSPIELFRIGDQAKWRVRCVPNLFGALSPKENLQRKISDIYISMGGFGQHEVIIENPKHNTCIALMNEPEVQDIIRAYKSRYLALRGIPGIETVIIFKNHGTGAGTSLEHPHSQVIAVPVITPQTKTRAVIAEDFYEKNGQCVYCRMVEEELKLKTRVVLETEHFVSFIPFASVMPFITWICPKRHCSSFGSIEEAEIVDLARNLRTVLQKLYYGLSNPDFNYTIRSYRAKDSGEEYLHWELCVIPRLTTPAGFELGTAMFVNTALPEESAEFLRKVSCS